MKKSLTLLLVFCILLSLAGCSHKNEIKKTVESNMKTYYEMEDGTWSCDGISYKYRLEIKGRLNNAASDSVFVYLSNLPEITFNQAWRAAGLSSDTSDYFDVNDAILVEWRTE